MTEGGKAVAPRRLGARDGIGAAVESPTAVIVSA